MKHLKVYEDLTDWTKELFDVETRIVFTVSTGPEWMEPEIAKWFKGEFDKIGVKCSVPTDADFLIIEGIKVDGKWTIDDILESFCKENVENTPCSRCFQFTLGVGEGQEDVYWDPQDKTIIYWR